MTPGQIVFTVVTNTSIGIKARLLGIGTTLDMNSNNDHSVHDSPPGQPGRKYEYVPRTYVFDANGGRRSYTDSVQGVVAELAEINKASGEHKHKIVSVRFMPTNSEQFQTLSAMKSWIPNLVTV